MNTRRSAWRAAHHELTFSRDGCGVELKPGQSTCGLCEFTVPATSPAVPRPLPGRIGISRDVPRRGCPGALAARQIRDFLPDLSTRRSRGAVEDGTPCSVLLAGLIPRFARRRAARVIDSSRPSMGTRWRGWDVATERSDGGRSRSCPARGRCQGQGSTAPGQAQVEASITGDPQHGVLEDAGRVDSTVDERSWTWSIGPPVSSGWHRPTLYARGRIAIVLVVADVGAVDLVEGTAPAAATSPSWRDKLSRPRAATPANTIVGGFRGIWICRSASDAARRSSTFHQARVLVLGHGASSWGCLRDGGRGRSSGTVSPGWCSSGRGGAQSGLFRLRLL